MMRPFVEAVKTFKSQPFRSAELVEKLGLVAHQAWHNTFAGAHR
jgi:hypothetical protein